MSNYLLACKNCAASVTTEAPGDPESQHAAVDGAGCTCCSQEHSHAGEGCRPISITVLRLVAPSAPAVHDQ